MNDKISMTDFEEMFIKYSKFCIKENLDPIRLINVSVIKTILSNLYLKTNNIMKEEKIKQILDLIQLRLRMFCSIQDIEYIFEFDTIVYDIKLLYLYCNDRDYYVLLNFFYQKMRFIAM